MTSCFVCIPYLRDDEALLAGLREGFDDVTVHPGPDRPDAETLKRVVGEYDAALCGVAEAFDAEVAAAVDDCTALGSLSVGLDHVDVEAFRDRGVDVVNVEEANVVAVAEHTWALALALAKRVVEGHEAVVDGTDRDGLGDRPTELRDRTVGVVGAGPIAHEVTTLAEAFGVDPLVWTFHPDRHPEFDPLDAAFVDDLPALVERSDVVTVHVRLSDRTEGLLSPATLADVSTDRERLLVNTARAPIVDRGVVERVGPDGVFDAVALDVYPDDPVDLAERAAGRVRFTPHVAGLTREATRRMRSEVAGKLAAVTE